MAKYRKVDNCGPVPYPDQSGRYLGEGEVVEDDAGNDWAPLVALGFVVETEASATPDKQETPAELAKAVEPPALALVDEPAEEEAPKSKRRSRKKKKAKSEEVNDGGSSNDGAGAEEVDTSEAGESDS